MEEADEASQQIFLASHLALQMEVGEVRDGITNNKRMRKEVLSVKFLSLVFSSVADPYVFGPPGSGSFSQRFGSGSRSFYHQAKIVRKTLIPTAL